MKKIDDSDNVDMVIVGNSHSNGILLNRNEFYMNESGAIFFSKNKQIEFSIKEFKNLKYILLNLSPAELYRNKGVGKRIDNLSLYKNSMAEVIEYFSLYYIKHPKAIFYKKEELERHYYYEKNGRKNEKVRKNEEKDWLRNSHFQSGFIADKILYQKNLTKYEKLISEIDENIKLIIITMPHNYRYLDNLVNKTAGLFDSTSFFNDINNLSPECYLNFLEYPLEDIYYKDGDHLNEIGENKMKSLIVDELNLCISKL